MPRVILYNRLASGTYATHLRMQAISDGLRSYIQAEIYGSDYDFRILN